VTFSIDSPVVPERPISFAFECRFYGGAARQLESNCKLRDQTARVLANKCQWTRWLHVLSSYSLATGRGTLQPNIGKLLELLRMACFKALAYLVE
jgi:hypothetical protein